MSFDDVYLLANVAIRYWLGIVYRGSDFNGMYIPDYDILIITNNMNEHYENWLQNICIQPSNLDYCGRFHYFVTFPIWGVYINKYIYIYIYIYMSLFIYLLLLLLLSVTNFVAP